MTVVRSAAVLPASPPAPRDGGDGSGTAGPTVHAARPDRPGGIRPCGPTDKTAPPTGPPPARPTTE